MQQCLHRLLRPSHHLPDLSLSVCETWKGVSEGAGDENDGHVS